MRTMLTPSDFGEARAEKMMMTTVAGLQFYDYATHDDLIGEVIPAFGDRVQLVRQPYNRHDRNAVQVMWRDSRVMLGHLPREVAADLAPMMDAGALLRGYVLTGGDGSAWSAAVAICGDAIPRKWQRHSMAWRRRFWVTYDDGQIAARERAESCRRAAKGDAIEAAEIARRDRRRANAAHALAMLVVGGDEKRDLATLPRVPTEAESRRFGWWDDIPSDEAGPILRTKTHWGDAGYRLMKDAPPFATIEYGSGKRHRVYHLFGAHQVVAKKRQTPAQLAAVYARDVR